MLIFISFPVIADEWVELDWLAFSLRNAAPLHSRRLLAFHQNLCYHLKYDDFCHHSGYLPPRIETPEVILEETHV